MQSDSLPNSEDQKRQIRDMKY